MGQKAQRAGDFKLWGRDGSCRRPFPTVRKKRNCFILWRVSVVNLQERPETAPRPKTRTVVLVGHPNVGKSAVFSQLTGRFATISNFPGTTVDIFRGAASHGDREYQVIDTPGVNSLAARSEDERVTLGVLRDERPDLIVQVADGKNIRRSLMLTAQLARLDIPLVLNLNMKDEREERGIRLDLAKLSRKLGVPVVETVAISGEGIQQLRESLDSEALASTDGQPHALWAEDIIGEVLRDGPAVRPGAANPHALLTALMTLGVVLHVQNYLGGLGMPTLFDTLQSLASRWIAYEPLAEALAVTLGFLAPVLGPALLALKIDPVFRLRLGIWARRPLSGFLILALTLSLMYQLVGKLGAQSLVEALEGGVFGTYFNPFLQTLVPLGFFYDLLVGEYGLVSVGLTYGVAIVLPVVFTFFVGFSFLEDSGYLPRVSLLSDRLFRPMGLNGKAFLPMVLGLGCVTMATMTTRILDSKKERVIATILLALGVPCSAQLGVILGITAGVSPWATALVFGTVFLQLFFTGFALSRMIPGDATPFILEVPPIRYPVWENIFKKTFLRVKWFLKEALPLFILGSFVLFALEKLNLLGGLIAAVEPVVVGLLDLPRETATAFFIGFLRRDYGAAGLFDLARHGQLSSVQVVVSLTVMMLFVPCIANLFVIIRERRFLPAAAIFLFITVYAVAVGTALNFVLRFLNVSF